jgi:hypothetical protein
MNNTKPTNPKLALLKNVLKHIVLLSLFNEAAHVAASAKDTHTRCRECIETKRERATELEILRIGRKQKKVRLQPTK